MKDEAEKTARLYGRRKGRPLRVRKSGLMETLLPALRIELPPGKADPAAWFDFKPKELWLEIGFGGGEHLAAQAALHPENGFIGCEPFINGVAGLLDHIDKTQLRNIRIFPEDARQLVAALPDSCLDRVYILFADPWPKKRHAERRFVQPETLKALARAMKPGAPLMLASDDPVLQEWTAEQMKGAADFTPLQGDGISTVRSPGWIETRYETKALQAGRVPMYFCFKKLLESL